MTNTRAIETACVAWSRLVELAQSKGSQGAAHDLKSCLHEETRKGGGTHLPMNLARVRLVQSALSGAERPMRDIGDLYGIRQAHVQAMMMIGARLDDHTSRYLRDLFTPNEVDAINAAGEVLFKAWSK